MRGPSNDLHELVHTLNLQEIKTCRKRMRDSGSGIRRLFEVLLKQTQFEEKACREASGQDLNDNQWAVRKNYLHQSIMAALMHRRRKELSAWNVRTHLQYLELLYGKELYKQCRKKLKQIARTVEKLDDPILRNEVLMWQYRLHSRNYHQVPMEEFEALHQRFLHNNQLIQDYLRCQYLHQQFLYILRNRGMIQARGTLVQAFEAIMSDPLLAENAQPSSLGSQLLCDYTLGTWKYMQADYAGAHQRFQRVVHIMEERRGWQFSHPDLYFGALFWYSLSNFEIYDFAECHRISLKMEQLRADSAYNRARLFYYKAHLQRSEASILGDAQANQEIAQRIFDELPEHQDRCRPAEVMNLYFNIGLSFIIGDALDRAMHCFLKILQFPALKEIPEYELTTKLLLLLLCLEKDDRTLYRHYRRSLLRLLARNPEAYPLETLVLEGLAEIAKARNPAARKTAREALEIRLKNLEGASPNRYFDFEAWFLSRNGDATFLEIYQERALKEMPPEMKK